MNESDEIATHCLARRTFKSVQKDGKWIHVQKRLILVNLKEIFNKFKNDFPDVKIGLSKFCELQPRHVIIAGPAGTHSVSVRVQHQYIKIMVDAIKLNKLTKDKLLEKNVSTLKNLLALMSCSPPTED
jgi:predicted transport protein